MTEVIALLPNRTRAALIRAGWFTCGDVLEHAPHSRLDDELPDGTLCTLREVLARRSPVETLVEFDVVELIRRISSLVDPAARSVRTRRLDMKGNARGYALKFAAAVAAVGGLAVARELRLCLQDGGSHGAESGFCESDRLICGFLPSQRHSSQLPIGEGEGRLAWFRTLSLSEPAGPTLLAGFDANDEFEYRTQLQECGFVWQGQTWTLPMEA
ncbi:MAG: hypothetical protein Q8O67_32195 [Deltaproteobacteria bacterium]|nr:hypothetical protein [Deltaproteobacteria bacterium]